MSDGPRQLVPCIQPPGSFRLEFDRRTGQDQDGQEQYQMKKETLHWIDATVNLGDLDDVSARAREFGRSPRVRRGPSPAEERVEELCNCCYR
jgi:hypothetical protein